MTALAARRHGGGHSALPGLSAAVDEAAFGGKATALSSALRAGLPVPDGWAIAAAQVAELVTDESLARSVLASLGTAAQQPLAVRSSAVGEDSADSSFAGQHATRLGVVGVDALLAALRDVHASASAQGALQYRRLQNIDATPRIAVVLQRMVRASTAGVVFTRNPISGAREFIVEAVRGLGEMLVGGRATPARWRFDVEGTLLKFHAGTQQHILVLDPDGHTREVTAARSVLDQDVLSAAAIAALLDLARRCEALYRTPLDLEWAFEGDDLFLLQARPISTLQRDAPARRRNVLHGDPGRGILWSRVNVGEAIPGTVRALTAEFHRDSIELSPQRMFQRMGVLPAGAVHRPQDPAQTPSQFLCGRMALNVDYMRAIADRIPGTSSDALEEAVLGSVRRGVQSRRDRRRYPIVALKLLWIVLTQPRRLRRLHARTERAWRAATQELAAADLQRALAIFEEGRVRYGDIIVEQALIATLASGFWDPVARIVRRIGTEDDLLQLTAGYGNVLEARMLERLWQVSRGRLPLEDFLHEYGYMAASAGELMHPSWREDPTPLRLIAARYAALPEAERPAARQRTSRENHERARRRLLAAAPWPLRLALRASLRLAARMLPIREVGKACMVMGTDIGRAAARRIGVLLATRGDLCSADDVFDLTLEELRAGVAGTMPLRAAVARNRRLHAGYQRLELPDAFTSEQLAELLERGLSDHADSAPTAVAGAVPALRIQGVGVSRGRYTGVARVVRDPNAVDGFEPGAVLVCNITDPGWAALFSIAGAMVVDIGGMLSHSAIIARELGIPAVVNTRDGTQRIPDGARVTVDGAAGVVEILT